MVTLEPPSSLTLMFFSSSYFSSFSSSSTYSFTIIFSFSISPLLLFFLLTPQFHDLHEYWTTLHYNGTLDSHSLPLARGAKTHWNYQSINCSIENQSTILCWPEKYKIMKDDRNITRADKMFHIAWGSPAHLRSLLTDNLWREYKSKISKGQFSWTGGVRWEESGLRGCSTGGGEETELGDASHQLKTLQVTRETLSSRAGAMVIYSNLIQEVALGNLVTIFVCYQGGGPHAWQWPGEEAGEEVKTRQVEPVGDGGVVEGGVENSSASRLRFEADCI